MPLARAPMIAVSPPEIDFSESDTAYFYILNSNTHPLNFLVESLKNENTLNTAEGRSSSVQNRFTVNSNSTAENQLKDNSPDPGDIKEPDNK